MHRPLFLVGFSSLWALLLITLVPPGKTVAAAVGLLVISTVLFFVTVFIKSTRKEKLFPVAFASVALISAVFLIKTYFIYNPVTAMCGNTYEITGHVVSVSGKNSSDLYVCTVKVGEIKQTGTKSTSQDTSYKKNGTKSSIKSLLFSEGLPNNFKIKLSSKTYEGKINEKISFSGKLYIPGKSFEEDDPRTSASMVNYYKAKDIFVGVTAYSGVKILEGGNYSKIPEFAYNVRKYIEKTVGEYIAKDYAGVLVGMLTGDKSEISDEIYDSFKTAGVVHLLSVSGFHCSLWGMLVYRQLLKVGIGKRFSACMTIVFLVVFTVVTGMSKSTVRAAVMLIVFFIGRVFTRDPDSINSLGFAALLIVLSNPFVCGDTGFLFSFFSTLGIFVFYPPLKKKVRPAIKKKVHNFYVRQRINSLSDILLISVCTMIFNFPFVMLFIGDTSLVSPLANLVVTPLSSLAIFFTGVGSVLDTLPLVGIFSKPVFLVAGVCSKVIVFVCGKISLIPFASVFVGDGTTALTVCSVILMVAFTLLSRKVRPAFAVGVCTAFFIVSETMCVLLSYIY